MHRLDPPQPWRSQRSRPRASAPAIACLALVAILCACGKETHPEVLLVVNGESPISVAIGQYYAERRGIPDANRVVLSVPVADPMLASRAHEVITREVYEERVRRPLEAFLIDSGLREQVTTLVVTKGVPLRIQGEDVPRATWLRDTTRASVDAELSLLFSTLSGSAGVAGSVNPWFSGTQSFSEFRADHPEAPLRYLVARLTGYQVDVDPETGIPGDIRALIDGASAETPPSNGAPLWLFDLDPRRSPAQDAGNQLLFSAAAAGLRALGLAVEEETTGAFAANRSAVQGYASWGSNDSADLGPPYYGSIGEQVVPGEFAPRAVALDLVSTNGRSFMAPPSYGQSLVADLVRIGAAGVAGHVDEPALAGVARPEIFFRRFAQGAPAIEAFYQSLPYLGWMNFYVGDPLMTVPEPAGGDPDDLDHDGIPNEDDNCTLLPNPEQRDSDADGFGNLCDPDVTGDGVVTTSFGSLYPLSERGDIEQIALSVRGGRYVEDHDLDGDGRVDQRDVSIAMLRLFLAPGPSGLAH